MGLKLSILDQSPVFPGETVEDAFRHTLEIARLADRLGYHRFWVSEHHDSRQVAGSSPEVLIAYLLAHTERIRVGSGGVMLQHYSPYKVAENFNVLSALAPGRVDLGIGRAPGGLPVSTRALQQGVAAPAPLEEKLEELARFLRGPLPEGHPLAGLHASPAAKVPPALHLLGASASSAELAARQGLPYAFALFINGDADVAESAFKTYRERFGSETEASPEPILALSVIVADTDEEAAALAADFKNVKVKLASGKSVTVGTVEQAETFGKQSGESYEIEVRDADITKGSKETVRKRLLELRDRFGVDELIVTTAVPDFSSRVRSFLLLQEAFAETRVG
ncbi:LLM class flavin-dependent oxidoreductase [Cohnella thermotolerans]|jgi:luciferase family oxidoreductase group 1|uniref:LLM class flavin-dependent oxidoreductase n=1 Tax=Cohnella thermotolerans TaxID=329858 RepID=UPI00040D12EB|nr:LLM class flavin-dependent oxidoreductase [Cohnella thermotolerans]